MIWVDLLVTGVTGRAPVRVLNGLDADALLLEHGPGVELAEAMAGVAASLEDWLPDTDTALLAVVTRDGVPTSNLTERGLLVVRPDGGLGFTIGRGHTIESVGESLAIVQAPEPGRYMWGFRVPGYKYWGV